MDEHNEAKYKLRRTDPRAEMAWLVMVVDPNGTDHEWCESEELATAYSEQALADARDGEYEVTVYVLKCLRQNGEKP